MSETTFTPGPAPNSVRAADGRVLKIPRVKGKRREVRRMLAQRSQELLSRYRREEAVGECPLKKALAGGE